MELLSPAGNLETAIAAFAGGADAVYCGLGRFNARERAENFTPETLGKLLQFARKNDKKVYLTLNTLVWQSELGAFFEQLLELEKMPPNALIVQDPGVIAIVRKYFPDLPLHASTQMGIHNSAGIAIARSLGIRRVILERQITMDELHLISKHSGDMELEVFLHGSLCCSLSGRCLLSHNFYGESGNRGRCKQPCRRAFDSRTGKNMRILSPADLVGSSLIDELKKAGVVSLKIEGRLRTPDYIWKTAKAYRILLDNPGDPEASAEAETIFQSVPGRRKSTGFYFSRQWGKLIVPEENGTFGECCAVVRKVLRTGIMVNICTSLHLGDRLRLSPVSGGDGESFTLSSMENYLRKKILRGRAGETVFITGKFKAVAGDEVRRIGENGFDFSRQAASLPEYKRTIPLNISCSASKWQAKIPGIRQIWQMAVDFAPAEKVPLSAAKIKEIFAEALPPGFAAGEICCDIQGNFFVPAAELKNLRRRCWEFFAPHLYEHDFFPEHQTKMEDFYAECTTVPPDLPMPSKCKKFFWIPPFISEHDLVLWQKKTDAAYASGVRDFTASHWHAFEMLKKFSDINIYACYPFHITNSFAVKLAESLGASSVSITPECPEKSALTAVSMLPVVEDNQNIPLLVSRAPLLSGTWHDHFGHSFRTETCDGFSFLYTENPSGVSGKNQP